MVMLAAFAAVRGGEVAAVATFDHGTGTAATRAARLVERTALAYELPVVSGALPAGAARTEAEWRTARWRFLRGWAEELRATIVTAHTWDDQVETVVLRILRGAGARGLAGMLAHTASGSGAGEGLVAPAGRLSPMRPLLGVRRADIATYARARRVPFHDDPSNARVAHQRNRVRLEILPALERARPGFSAWCWDISVRAAALRTSLSCIVDERVVPRTTPDGALVISLAAVRGLRATDWALLWPEFAARVGVAMDRRGIERAAEWAVTARPGSRIPLSGGAAVERTASTFVLRGAAAPSHLAAPSIYIEGNDE
jgi:tRNA(Ile)-lysidine synthase